MNVIADRFPEPAELVCDRDAAHTGPFTQVTTTNDDGSGRIYFLCWPCADAEFGEPGAQQPAELVADLVADLAALVETAAAIDEAQLLERVLEPEDVEPCGARRPGWERPGPGRHRLPCVREGHEGDGDHRNAIGETWPPSCQDCGTTSGPLEDAATAPEPVLQEVLQEVDEPVLQEQAAAVRVPVRMCARCEHITPTPVLVLWIDSGSGPGWSLYACPGCAHLYLTPDAAWRLTIEHAVACPGCHGDGLCATGQVLERVHRAARDRARTTGRPERGGR